MNRTQFPELNVYVGCALTHASTEFRTKVEMFKAELKKVCNVLCFLGVGGKETPYEIYYHDIHNCVMRSDLVVAIVDLPSTGLGYEMATQIEARRKPLLAVAHNNAIVSDLILDTRQPGFQFLRYADLHKDVIPVIVKILEGIHERRHHLPLFSKSQTEILATQIAV